jgi:polar amino acid transport system substrate-binding protein
VTTECAPERISVFPASLSGRVRFPALAAVLLAGLAAVLGGCATPANSSAAPGAASAVSYPTQDVVSGIAVDPAASSELPAAVRAAGTLGLGTTLTPGTSSLPHGGVAPNGADIGLDKDLRDAVARTLGISWTVRYGSFATIIPGVQNGKYDVGQANFGVTAAREKVVDFTTYLNDGQAFLGSTASGLAVVHSLTDLCGLVVATSPGSTFQQILTDGASRCAAAGKKPYTVQLFADTAPIWLGLANSKIDVFFGPTLTLRYDATHVPNVRFLGQFSTTPVGFVTAKGSPLAPALRDAVNDLIQSGAYAKILAKWGVTSSAIPASTVNPQATL